jgi:redox-sensitive bicupin YhaK (pirin superfamily)
MSHALLGTVPLGFPWTTVDPFLFCVHHVDAYPQGNGSFGPAASLDGREIGMDFDGLDGWRMYHGEHVPGFPAHPHRGFETVTVTRRGFVDHSDSLGAAARYGQGDVQWLTAGRGIVHSEMFPLLRTDRDNPLELFQIWLNLPAADKMAPPHFEMMWEKDVPKLRLGADGAAAGDGPSTEIVVAAGSLFGARPPAPPPHSWAARRDSDVAIATLRMDAGARLRLPPAASAGTNRTLYFWGGPELVLDGDSSPIREHAGLRLRADAAVDLHAPNGSVELLLLQGRPIGEPVAQHGPFVMNHPRELQQAFFDYQRTRFGGWPWPDSAPVHGGTEERFAKGPGSDSAG